MPRQPRTPKTDTPYPPGWEPFLDAIRAEMSDDTARLVFADWLQENGDEDRAELIRVQCALEHASAGDPANPERHRRETELLNANWDRWTTGFPDWIRRDRFSHGFGRGFIASIRTTAARFLKDGDAVTRLTTLENVGFTRSTAEVFRSPFLARVSGLYLEPVDSGRVDALAGNSNLSLIRHLHIGTGCDSRGLPPRYHVNGIAIGRLLANPSLVGLRQFILNGPAHGEAVAHGLAAARFACLEELDLVNSRLTAEGLKAVVMSASAGSCPVCTWAATRSAMTASGTWSKPQISVVSSH